MTNDRHSARNQIYIPLAVVAGIPLLGAVILFLVFMFGLESGSIPREKMNQVQRGDSLEEVADLLGKPAEISTNEIGSVVWVYKRPFRWRFIKITARDNKVVQILQE